ncbi:MAG TPA: hypothetical protein VIG29_01540 [Vicinamibacteria bacterium]|jgi:hypothetical protein
MYSGNTFSRRRPEGWAERRRYFRKLLANPRPVTAEAKPKQKVNGSSK